MDRPRIQLRYFQGRVPNPKQWAAHLAAESAMYVGMVGAARSGKSVWLIEELIDRMLRYPGFAALLARWTDESTLTKIKPMFYEIIRAHYTPDILGIPEGYFGPAISKTGWVASEERQFFVNGSYVYIHGLKSGDDTNRYAKIDGLSLAGVFISQAEEVPKDFWDRLKTRLSLNVPGMPRQMLFELNPTTRDHYLYREFVEERDANHIVVNAATVDNAENLPPQYIDELEREYPPGHPLRHRLLEGSWGLTSKGDPVFGELFNSELHVREVEYDPTLPLLISYDPGVRHPAVTWAQITPDGQLRVLDCLLGTDVFADDFFAEVFQRQFDTFGDVRSVKACADRASQQRRGPSKKTEWDIFNEHLRPWRVTALVGVVASKEFLIQRLASRMSRLVRGQPALVVHPRAEYLIEALAGGYVWRAPTENRPVARLPMQDGYYEHGMDTLLYVEMHFGPGIRKMERVRERDENPPERRKPKGRATAAGW